MSDVSRLGRLGRLRLLGQLRHLRLKLKSTSRDCPPSPLYLLRTKARRQSPEGRWLGRPGAFGNPN